MPPLPFTRTRLAPSPTGALHLGHARTFLITWWLARAAGAQIVMRMDDLDAARAKPASVQQAYNDLHWLGLDWDQTHVIQSQRRDLYDQALEKLWAQGAIYPCVCTRAEIAAAVAASIGAPQEGDAQFRYTGTCRPLAAALHGLTVAAAAARVQAETGRPPCWRLAVPPGPIAFHDALAGPQSFDIWAEAGDFPLTRFDGSPAYQLACVVDDADLGIDMVIRGDDLLSSTPRQILLYRALALPEPRFAHVPLVIGPDGKRLAKRHGESRLAQFRQHGVSPEKIVGWAAWRSGQLEKPREITAPEILATFDPARLPRDRLILTPADLAWLR